MERSRAATILALLFGVAAVLLTVGMFLQSVRSGDGLNDTALALLLLVEGSLTGIVGGYLGQTTQDRSWVGTILTITLGVMTVIVTAYVLGDALWSSSPSLSSNVTKVLAAMLGGIIGSLLGFMGITRPPDKEE